MGAKFAKPFCHTPRISVGSGHNGNRCFILRPNAKLSRRETAQRLSGRLKRLVRISFILEQDRNVILNLTKLLSNPLRDFRIQFLHSSNRFLGGIIIDTTACL